MARFRMEGSSLVGEYGVDFVVNPSGTVWGVHEDHPSPLWPRKPGDPVKTLVELAERREDGWRLATEDEIRRHAKDTGEWLPPELEKAAKSAATSIGRETPIDAEAQGKAAAEAGEPKSANPFDGRSRDHRAWDAGYDSAQAPAPQE